MAINTELLEKVKQHILEEPRRYAQGDWGSTSKSAPCGTEACLAGWAFMLTGGSRQELLDFAAQLWDYGYPVDAPDVRRIARERLGLSEDDADVLFSAGEWPEEFQAKYDDALTRKAKARAAADYIDHIITTGKVTD